MNNKKLIFGIFRPIDLVIFISGVCATTILLIIFMSLENSNSIMTIISLLPAIICTLLVMPLKKNHNVLSAICHFIKKQ